MSNIDCYVAEKAVRVRAWKSRMETARRLGEPNPGHLAIVALERRGKLLLLITQNIDGLHADAGLSPERIVEIHGTFREVSCLSCGERNPMSHAFDRVDAGEEDPDCQGCGGILKSATVSFGQSLVEEDLERSAQAAHSCDLLLAVGSKLSVFPAANMVPIAKQAGARIVILNGEPTEMDHLADAVVHDSISAVLPRMVEALG
jgi:NAD-dependent deacetylase